MRNRLIIPVLAALALVGLAAGPASASASPGTYDTGVAAALQADGMASTSLNSTTQVYMAGDTPEVLGQRTQGGFDHFELLTEPDGSGVLTPVPTHYGYPTTGGLQYQQFGCLDSSCPNAGANWADGTFFWPTGIFTDGSLWVPGVRVDGTGAVHGAYMAKFNLVTLAFEGVTQLPSTPAGGYGFEVYGGTVTLKSGRYLVATHDTPPSDPNYDKCHPYVTDCKIGDMVWIPNGTEASPASWSFHMGVFPSSLNVGTRISDMLDVDGSGSNYNAYSNVCDVCTGNGQYTVLHSSSLLSGWTGTVVDLPVSIPAGATHYGFELHPADSPSGQILASINVNGYPSGQYDPDFFLVTP